MGATNEVASLIVFFDGVCNLCNASVNFIIDQNLKNNIKFAPLQSAFAHEHLPTGIREQTDSIVLKNGNEVFIKSTAALMIARHLKFPFGLLFYFIYLPVFLRDPVYDFIAAHRFQWFGRRKACRLPSPELKDRFIDSPILS
jgi:predicted DCC family thiol-disulfide oxidoreductase YuxK